MAVFKGAYSKHLSHQVTHQVMCKSKIKNCLNTVIPIL